MKPRTTVASTDETTPMWKGSNTCLGCAHGLPEPFLDLGKTPLANSFVRPECAHLSEVTFRLMVVYCPACHLVQLGEIVPPEHLFTEYLYFSSYSYTFLAHARRMADLLVERLHLTASSRVLEIASNDGYLLQYFKERGISVLGIEPAKNVAAEADRRGIPTLTQFFGSEVVNEIIERFGRADLIIGNNVLAHVPTINDFLGAVKACLKPRGTTVFEVPYLKELLDKTEFDTIYHEHVFYFSLTAIKNLIERAGLELYDVSCQPVHGGSLRVFLGHKGQHDVRASVPEKLADEKVCGLLSPDRYARFSREVATLKEALVNLLCNLKAAGMRLAAYGAPAKGNTLLNYCGIGPSLLDFTVDRSPYKQGLLMPGSRLPIQSPEDLVKEMPDYTVILPWNLEEEIIAQQSEYLSRGSKFIIPLPKPRIV